MRKNNHRIEIATLATLFILLLGYDVYHLTALFFSRQVGGDIIGELLITAFLGGLLAALWLAPKRQDA